MINMEKIPTPEFLLERVRSGGVSWDEGKFMLLCMKAWINAAFSQVFLQRLLEEKIDLSTVQDLLYAHGQFQAREGVRIFNKRFGYPQTFSEISSLLDLHLGQFQLTGTGKYEWVLKDIANREFIIKGNSPLAEEYAVFFASAKRPVDHFVRGLIAGFISETLGVEVYCFESGCIAHGKTHCTFVIKEKHKFDTASEEWKQQEIKKEIDLRKDLSPRRDPLL